MAITAAICNSYKQEILQGVHAAADTYKIALFTNAANLSKATTAYAATNEVSGAGYTAGGATLAGFSTTLDGDTAILHWDTDPTWTDATISARGALIYNSSQSDKAVAVFDFGADITSTAGTFTVRLSDDTAENGLIRIA